MKRILPIAILSLTTFLAAAQTGEKTIVSVTRRTMTGAEANKMIAATKPKDSRVYDVMGEVVDPGKVSQLLGTYEYRLVNQSINGEYRHVLTKINMVRQAEIDQETRQFLKPKSEKLHEGAVLDLKPFKSRLDIESLKGKAVLLVFWCNGCYGPKDAYKSVNDVVSKFYDPEKFAIITVTHHSVEHATEALKKNPIVNTQHIIAAADLTNKFETDNRPVLVLTDTDHKVLYAVKDIAETTPRTLYFALNDMKWKQ